MQTDTWTLFFFFSEFLQPGNKKRAGESNKGIFKIKKKLPYLDKKNLEVTRFGQCVPVGRQN
jgi:hypothetical protein